MSVLLTVNIVSHNPARSSSNNIPSRLHNCYFNTSINNDEICHSLSFKIIFDILLNQQRITENTDQIIKRLLKYCTKFISILLASKISHTDSAKMNYRIQ